MPELDYKPSEDEGKEAEPLAPIPSSEELFEEPAEELSEELPEIPPEYKEVEYPEELPEEPSGDEKGIQASQSARPSLTEPAGRILEGGMERAGRELWPSPQPKPKNELSDLFEVPQPEDNDMNVEGLFEVPEENLELEEDLSDLTTIPDTLLSPEPRARKVQQYRRTSRPYTPPPSLGGLR